MRKTWIYPSDGSDPYELTEQKQAPSGAFFMPDIQPYKSMVTGEQINSRSRHREHLRQHGMVEMGNEMPKARPPERAGDDLKRDLHRVFAGYGH